MLSKFVIPFILLSLLGCDSEENSTPNPLTYQNVVESGVEGEAGRHTQVEIHTVHNPLGYYEYLPKGFNSSSQDLPLIIYWNGQNAGAGNGSSDLHRLLTQGLPQLINEGKHYPAIIISPMTEFKAWKSLDVDPFVDFVIKKYQPYISTDQIYMTGFSAGGGLTMRYAMKYPQKLAAIVPVSPAVPFPTDEQPSYEMANLSSWIFHNDGDSVVTADRSIAWHETLNSSVSDIHKLTIYSSDSHYAWQAAYADNDMWNWLLSQTK